MMPERQQGITKSHTSFTMSSDRVSGPGKSPHRVETHFEMHIDVYTFGEPHLCAHPQQRGIYYIFHHAAEHMHHAYKLHSQLLAHEWAVRVCVRPELAIKWALYLRANDAPQPSAHKKDAAESATQSERTNFRALNEFREYVYRIEKVRF